MAIKLATGPVTWGVDFADTPTNPPWQQVLDDISASGLPAMELGPVGYLPEEPGAVRTGAHRAQPAIRRIVHLRRHP